MTEASICIIDRDLPKNEGFYDKLMERCAALGMQVSYCKSVEEAPKADIWLLATVQSVKGVDNEQVVLGMRTINRKERLEIAHEVVPDSLIGRWAAPDGNDALLAVANAWGEKPAVLKYDWSAGRRGVRLLKDGVLPEDFDPSKDIVMECLDDDPYTYKADLCCGVLLNGWFLRTQHITGSEFRAFTKNPTQYTLPDELRNQLERLSKELMRYGSAYISVDMMQYEGAYKIIEINTNSVGRNISWKRFGDTYLETYPQALKQLLENRESLPKLGDVRRMRNQPSKILPPLTTKM